MSSQKGPYELKIEPELINDPQAISDLFKKRFPQVASRWADLALTRRSIDARFGKPQYILRFEFAEKQDESSLSHLYIDATKAPVHIIGAGPAGYFAALTLLTKGIKPIVFDRGKDAQSRRRDLRAIMQDSIVNPDSNYCFGEGGAGTYSDGKLYTRSTKRGNIRTVLNTFCSYGADGDILVNANPHIGSNKLPKIIEAMRKAILDAGGEIHFNKKLEDFKRTGDQITELHFQDGEVQPCSKVILATGHSARDIFTLLHERQVLLEAKAFAMGARVEHSQQTIDQLQYHCSTRPDNLPAAAYSVVTQVDGRGVFSFCMCPGGMIVPSATAPGEIVMNGMSPSRRDSPYANSGLVTSVELADIPSEFGDSPLRAMYFQQHSEQMFFQHGNGSQQAPAQLLTDFVLQKHSSILPASSYVPGIYPADLNHLLPASISVRIRTGVKMIGNKMRGYLSEDAVIVGLESRTSSPVRIPRDKITLLHPQVSNLYPCGEGAGYAGGIVSAAIDGMKIAEQIIENRRLEIRSI